MKCKATNSKDYKGMGNNKALKETPMFSISVELKLSAVKGLVYFIIICVSFFPMCCQSFFFGNAAALHRHALIDMLHRYFANSHGFFSPYKQFSTQ